MKIIHFILLALLIHISFKFCFAQSDYRIVRPSLNEQLSNNYIHCIHQDNSGFMWFGTDGGLKKYDGYNISEYVNDPDDTNSLSNNLVFTIYEDPLDSGTVLWLGTSCGLVKLNRLSGKFYQFNNTRDKDSPIMDEDIQSICKDRNGNYWLGGKSLSRFDRTSETFSYHLEEIEQLFIYSICEDQLGILWLGSSLGLIKYDSDSSEDKNYTIYPLSTNNPYKINRNMITSVLEDKKGLLWVGTYDGVFLFNKESEKFIRPELKVGDADSHLVFEIHEDKDGNLWIGCETLIKINSSRDTLIRYKQYLVEDSSIGKRISTLCVDSSGIIWMGLSNHGINKCIPNLTKFKHYEHIPGDDYSLMNNSVTSFGEDNSGNIWISVRYGGINKFDKENNKFLIGGVSPVAINLSISKSDILWYSSIACLTSHDINIEIATAHFANGAKYGPSIFMISEKQNINIKQRDSLFNTTDVNLIRARDYSNGVFYCFVDSKGVIWNLQGQGRTIYQYDETKVEYVPYQIFTDEDISNSILMLFEDSEGTIWFGTNGKGLIKRNDNSELGISNKKDSFYQYRNELNNSSSLSNDKVNVICEAKLGNLWIGTEAGLNEFNKKSEIFTRYGIKNGLPSEDIAGIVEDDFGNIWISTNKGLSRFDPELKSFKNFDRSSGLQSNVFNDRCCFKDSDGLIYFGGPNGFNMFDPQEIKEQKNIPNITITGFQIFNKPVFPGPEYPLEKSIEFCDKIILDYDQDVVTFEFAGLEYTNPEKNKYAYIMEGVDPDWVSTDANRRFATYTKLDPGEYTFRVKGSNNDGFWNDSGTAIRIIILPPWWKTNWAFSIYFLLTIGLLYLIWRFQTNQLKLKHQAEIDHLESEKFKEMDRLKSRFFANISHEFRTPLTLILGPIKQIIENIKDIKTKEKLSLVHRNATKLFGLVNQLLYLSKLEAGKMNLNVRQENLVPLLKGMVLSFVSLAETKNISIIFNSFVKELNLFLDVDKFGKIINNLLSNAIKFNNEGGTIEIDVSKNENSAEIKIADSGIGISKERLDNIFDRFYQVDNSKTREFEGTGIGLSLTKELVELHNGTIKVNSDEGLGTTFKLTFPLRKNRFTTKDIKELQKSTEKEFIVDTSTDHIENNKSNEDKIKIETLLNTEKPVLLVVEDNEDVRNYIINFLKEDYIIIEAVNGLDGIDKSLEYIPDLIISDVMMPKMDGFELCSKIKSDEKTSHIPVILLTAKASIEDKIDGLETGADDYLMKPFDAKELQIRIINLIEQRKKLREKFKKTEIIKFDSEKVNSVDTIFLQNAIKNVNENLSDDAFSVQIFADNMAMSRSQLHRKLIALIDESPGDLIRRIRLTKAKDLINQKFGNVSEIAFEVGYNNPANFSRSFTNYFGVSPSQYLSKYS